MPKRLDQNPVRSECSHWVFAFFLFFYEGRSICNENSLVYPKVYIYTLRNYFDLKVCFLAKYMYKCSCPAHYLIYTSHFQDRVLKYTVK